MKKYMGLFALMSLFVACNAVESPFGGTRPNAYLGIPSEAFLSENEQAAIDEINYARTQPKDYAYNILKPFLDNKCYSDELRETYVQTAFDTMVAMKPVAPLQAVLGLTLAARDFIADPGRNVHTSTSKGFEGVDTRAKLYGSNAYGGEIAWDKSWSGDGTGTCYPAETVTSGWIIDRGTAPGYVHRKIILDADSRYIGLAFGYGAANATVEKYRDRSATYATLGRVPYTDKNAGDYKTGASLTLTSISEVVTWPVLRYENGKFFKYNAAGVKVAEETRTIGVRTTNVR